MAIHASAVVAISAALMAAVVWEAAAARERGEAEAAALEAAAAWKAHAAQEAIAQKDADVKVLEQALPQGRGRKEADMRAKADATKREAIETAQQEVAGEKAKTEAEIRALEAEEAQLQQQREQEAARAHKEATAPAMNEAERKIQCKTLSAGSRVNTLRRFFDGHPAYGMKM